MNCFKKGFTLVELLVTIAVIGILSAMSVQAYREYTGRLNNTIALADARSLWTAGEAFYSLNPQITVFSNCYFHPNDEGAARFTAGVANCDSNSPNSWVPGYKKNKRVNSLINFTSTTDVQLGFSRFSVWSLHCDGKLMSETTSHPIFGNQTRTGHIQYIITESFRSSNGSFGEGGITEFMNDQAQFGICTE